MGEYATKSDRASQQVGSAREVAQSSAKPQGGELADARPEAAVQRQLEETVNRRPEVQRVAALQAMMDGSPRTARPAQLKKTAFADVAADSEVEAAASLFNPSRLNRAPKFEKTETIPTHSAADAIAGYTRAVAEVGNRVADFNFLDRALAIPAWPGDVAWAAAGRVPYLTALAAAYDISLDYLEAQFPAGSDPVEAQRQFNEWRDQRGSIQNKKWVGLNDPFILLLRLRSRVRGQNDWEIDTQFNDSSNGYITRIHHGEHDITGSIASPAAFALAAGQAAGADEYLYSSTHIPPAGGAAPPTFGARTDAFAPHAAGDTKGAQDSPFDAFTAIAAEGARFIPVATLGGRAGPHTVLYTKPKSSGWKGARQVDLTWLTWNWGTHFGRRYNVTAQQIADVVAGLPIPAPPGQPQPIRSKPAGIGFNLTSDRVVEP